MNRTEAQNLGLTDQQITDPIVDELVVLARLDEAEWFMDGLKIRPDWGEDRIEHLRRRARNLLDKRKAAEMQSKAMTP